MRKTILALFAAMSAAACSHAIDEPAVGRAALITVVFDGRPADTLVVLATDSATIAAADRYVRTGAGPRMITGQIVRGPGIDPRFPFHYVPESVRLTDLAIELCDGEPMRTASAVNDFFEGATGSASSASAQWCPWASHPVAVEVLGATS